MFNKIPGYYKVEGNCIEIDKYYILSIKNPRKLVLLRLSCKTPLLAKRYIILRPYPENFEVISGEKALELGIKLSKKGITNKDFPTKYSYPKHCTTWQKRKQHRTNFRDDVRKVLTSENCLKQFTIFYRNTTYTIFDFTISSAFNFLAKKTGMTWKHFVTKVSTKPRRITDSVFLIKTHKVNLVMINTFNLKHHGFRINNFRGSGKISQLEKPLLQLYKAKPKSLLLHY